MSFDLPKAIMVVTLAALFCAPFAAAEELNELERQISRQMAKDEALEEKEKDEAQNLTALQKRLIAATADLQEKQKEQQEIEEKLASLEKQATEKTAFLSENNDKLAALTQALLRLSRFPPEALIFRSMLTDDHIHRAVLLRSLLPRVRADTDAIAKELADLEMLRRSVEEQKKLVVATRQNLEWQRSSLDEMVRTRQGLLKRTVSERAAIAKQLAALASEARDLGQLMDKANRNASKKYAPKLKLSGGMRLPVAGRVMRDFGAKDDYGVSSQGITLAAARSSPVVAPRDGKIVFVGPFKGYGQIVILQHGDGYHSFLAGFGRIDAEAGQSVAAGEPLGILAEKGQALQELYFEWRRNGVPIDPISDTKFRK